jgi:hypothetical protein
MELSVVMLDGQAAGMILSGLHSQARRVERSLKRKQKSD